MGSKNKKMQAEIDRLMIELLRKQSQPDPHVEKVKALNSSIIDWHTGTGVKDIRDHPTFGAKMPIYQQARNRKDSGRKGTGFRGIGQRLDSGYTKDLELADSFNRDIESAGMLETGLSNELGQAQTTLYGGAQLDLSRMGQAGSLGLQFGNDLQKRISTGGFGNFLKGLLPMVGQMGSAAITAGMI